MRFLYWLVGGLALMAAGCNTSGLSNAPRATFSQLACLDVNGDDRITADDAADASKVPDFNADRTRDADDAAFLFGVDVALDPARDDSQCEGKSKRAPEYLVAHGFFEPSDVDCDGDARAVLLVGVGGGAVNLKDKEDAAGIRSIVDDLLEQYDDAGVQTIGVIAGPAIAGAQQAHSAMEDWLTHAAQVYLERFPCLNVLLVGHSHGGVTVDVVAARIEGGYADRVVAVVDVDRVDELYGGDTQSRPSQVAVFNIFETNDPVLRGDPYESSNVENWDASGETGPEHGEEGGDEKPVNHTTIDNSESVRERIVEWVMERGANTLERR